MEWEEPGNPGQFNEKQYYMENYPKLAIEKGNMDELISMIIRGKEL